MALPYAIWVLGSAIVRAATLRIAQMLAKQGFKRNVGKAAEKLTKGKNPPVITKINQIKKVVNKAKVNTPKGTPKAKPKINQQAKPKTNQQTKPKTNQQTKTKTNQQKKTTTNQKTNQQKKITQTVKKPSKLKKALGWGVTGYGAASIAEDLWDYFQKPDKKPKKDDVKVVSKTDKATDNKTSSAKKSWEKGTGAVKVPGLTKEFIARAKRFDEKKEEKVSSNKKEKTTSKKDYKPVYDKAQAEKRKKLTKNIVSPKGVNKPKLRPFSGKYNKDREKLVNIVQADGSRKTFVAPKSYEKPKSKTNPSFKKLMKKVGLRKGGHMDYRKIGLFR